MGNCEEYFLFSLEIHAGKGKKLIFTCKIRLTSNYAQHSVLVNY